ncbi:MAG: dipeptidase [Candidatus Hodarchaeales archaeon]|jgi:membrane dipeptidase
MNSDLVIDCHADTLLKKYLESFSPMFSQNETFHVTKELLINGKVDIQVFALFVPPKFEKLGIEVTLEMIALAKDMEENGFFLVKTKKEFDNIKAKKRSPAMILSMEGAIALERNLKLLPVFYDLGIRNIGLSWSRRNLFCDGSELFESNEDGHGLSSQGKNLVEDMEKLGMVIDISHLNQKGVADVAKITSKPFIASHSNAFNLCPVSRNLRDNQLTDIASAGGVVGINFYSRFLSQTPEKASIDTVVNHIKYIAELIGVDHVGLGSDFDGIEMTPKGLENASKIKNIPPLLRKEGFSEKDINKVMGNNFQRVFKEVWC